MIHVFRAPVGVLSLKCMSNMLSREMDQRTLRTHGLNFLSVNSLHAPFSMITGVE